MAIAVDGSTPAGVSQTNGATATVVTASFSPPANSILVACWGGNSAVAAPSAPSISNTGSQSFSLSNWRSSADSGGAHGQCALWVATVGSAPGSMTVTVTSGSGSGDRQSRLRLLVLTGVDTASPTGATGEGTDSGAGLDTPSYTSTAANSVGILVASDWDVTSTTFTGAAGTTVDDSASPGSAINVATLRQTTPTTSGSTIALGLTSPTSTNWNFVYAEFKPDTSTGATNPRPPVVTPVAAVMRSASW